MLRLLGPMLYNSRPIQLPRKARALLGYLAVQERPQRRDEITALLCTDTDDPRRTLRTLLSHVRRGAVGALDRHQDRLAIRRDIPVDCKVFASSVLHSSPTDRIIELYAGEFMEDMQLPDCPEFELWLLSERVYYKSLLVRALLPLAHRHLRKGETASAYNRAKQAIALNPHLEEGHAIIVQIMVADGWVVEAKNYIDHFREISLLEIGVSPSDDFLHLADK